MSNRIEVKVPDIGDFSEVSVIEVLVQPGNAVSQEQSLITLESDKATMELPAPAAGMIASVAVKVNDLVSEGSLIAVIEVEEALDQVNDPIPEGSEAQDSNHQGSSSKPEAHEYDFDVVVLGSGPGGYTAAFRAADLGLKVALVERYPALGGVCLNVGCIPSKALLHTAQVIDETAAMADHGVSFGSPEIDLDKLRAFKSGVVERLVGGLAGMAKQRKVTVIQGTGKFSGSHEMTIAGPAGNNNINFANAIIAAGSQSLELSGLPWGDPRLMDSTGALSLHDIPERLLVIGGGIIGLEMACVFHALGSSVSVVELTSQLMPETDVDLVRVLHKRIKKKYQAIWLNTRVTGVDVSDNALIAHFEGENAPARAEFDGVLVAVGRVANGNAIGADKAGVQVDDNGIIPVDRQLRTNVPPLYAIGDITGQPMLAHRATHQGKVAAEVCAGAKRFFDVRVIPSVAYTDPEIAWVGVTDREARESGLDFGVGKFPWAASGRALGIGRPEGFTKLLFDNKSRRIIGAGMVGLHAGDLIAECALAIEMDCEAADIGLTVHPHPTLSESISMAAEAYEGTITDLYMPKP